MFKPHFRVIAMLFMLLFFVAFSVQAQEALPESFPVGTVVEGTVEAVNDGSVTIDGVTYYLTVKLTESMFVPGTTVSVTVVLSETEIMTIIRFAQPPSETDEDADDETGCEETSTEGDADAPTTTNTDEPCINTEGDHPVASAIAEAVEVDYDEVMDWHADGFGFGEIARAYLLAAETGDSVEAIMARRAAGEGWGSIIQEYGLNPSQFSLGRIMSGRYVNTGVILPPDVEEDGTLTGPNAPQPAAPTSTTTTSGSSTPATNPNNGTNSGGLNQFGCPGQGNSCNAPGHNN